MIDRKRVLAEFFELVQVRCSTLHERAMGDILTQRLTELGGAVVEDDAGKKLGGDCGNLVASFPGTVAAPTVLLTAHMDCVEPCEGVRPVLQDGVIRSDGTTILGADDKAGVVAILETLRQVKEQGIPHGPIQVVFTVAEEGGVNGSKNLDESLLHADLGYTLDTHGHPGKISYKAPGKNQIHIHVEGRPAHAGIAPEKGANAILAAARLLAAAPQGRIDEETTCNVGKIVGGTATNVVAEGCDIYYESRSRDKAKLDSITAKIVAAFEEGAAETDCKVTVTVKKDYDPYTLAEDSPAIAVARRAAEKLGFPVSIEESGGGSDANFFNAYGVPTAVLGVGMENGHTKAEYIEEKDLYDAAELTLQIVRDIAAK